MVTTAIILTTRSPNMDKLLLAMFSAPWMALQHVAAIGAAVVSPVLPTSAYSKEADEHSMAIAVQAAEAL